MSDLAWLGVVARGFSVALAVVDIGWGTLLCGTVAAAAYLIGTRVLGFRSVPWSATESRCRAGMRRLSRDGQVVIQSLRTSLVAGALAVAAVLGIATPAAAHAPMVAEPGNESPATAFILEDPTLSRAIGATLGAPGEVDWYRMNLRAGDALVVEVTAPDAAGGIPTSFAVLGPGLPAPTDVETAKLMQAAGADGALAHQAAGGEREVHGGLGFIAWGGIRTTAPADGTYWVAVRAAQDGATGKYVLAPGVREEFGLEAVGGMADLVAFFNAGWPQAPGDPPAATGVSDTLITVVIVVVGVVVVGVLAAGLRRRGLSRPRS